MYNDIDFDYDHFNILDTKKLILEQVGMSGIQDIVESKELDFSFSFSFDGEDSIEVESNILDKGGL